MISRKSFNKFAFVALVVLSLLLIVGAGTLAPLQQGDQPVGSGDPTAVPTEAPPAQDPNQLVSSAPQAQSAEEILAYWTPDRMAAAQPYPVPEVNADAIPDFHQFADEPQNVPSVTFPSGEPGAAGGDAIRSPVESTGGDVDLLGYNYPPPFTSYQIFPGRLYRVWPYITVGKVFFSSGGANFVCSGSSIGTIGAVLTAGHCVYGNGAFHTNWVFCPAYRDGTFFYGCFTEAQLWTLGGWVQGNLAYDIGGAVVNTNASGQTLASRVGFLGFSTKISREQHWGSFGYPAAAPFNGQRMWVCWSSHSRSDPNFSPQTIAKGCDHTGGSSGGPWIRRFNFSGGNNNLANGVNSYKYTTPNQPLQMYSPYFGQGALNLINQIRNASP